MDRKMILYAIVFLCLFVVVCAKPSDDRDEPKGRCGEIRCNGEEYQCIDDRCYCAPGFIPNHFQVRCVKCPGFGEKCFGQCCNNYGNETLHCYQGFCQPCYDAYGSWICSFARMVISLGYITLCAIVIIVETKHFTAIRDFASLAMTPTDGIWICRDNIKDILLVSSAQIAMGAALVFGIIATFILMYKLCAATNIRPLGDRSNDGSRLSIGSLQLYIEERLRDAPPRYTRATPAGTTNYPAPTYLNNGFVHDSSIPPPPYTEEGKTEDRITALHI